MHEENKLVVGLQGAAELIAAFTKFVNNEAIKNLSMPNIPMKTGGGKVWWRTLAEKKGWKLQRNILWGTCRILNPDNVRRAWGGEDAMKKALQNLA